MSQTYDVVQSWIDNVAYSHSKTLNTAAAYRHNFKLFCQFIGSTPEEILADYERSNERDFKRRYAQFIRSWISSMAREEFVSSTVVGRVGAVKSFFKYNDLSLGHVPIGKVSIEFHNRDIAKEEILLVMEGSRPREKAFYALMAQSGLRPETICKLQMKHLEPDLSKGTVPCKIDVPKEITKGQYRSFFTFIGEDALRYLKAWLSTRKNLTSESYLFTSYKQEGPDAPLDRSSISHRFGILALKLKGSGKLSYEQKKKGRPSELRLYNLRKYFRKYANQAGFEFVQFWMGHIVNAGKEENYRPQDVEFHRELYREKAMPFLRLETSTPTETEKTIEAQAQEIKDLREQLKAAQEKAKAKDADLEERIAKMESLLKSLQKEAA
jgi:site-specific recombinase XerD